MADALVALRRISKFLVAEELAEPYLIESDSKYALTVDGTFTWESVHSQGSKFEHEKTAKSSKSPPKGLLPTSNKDDDTEKTDLESTVLEDQPFQLNNLHMSIQRGAFVAIVGRVGSGKVSRRTCLLLHDAHRVLRVRSCKP